MTWLFTQLWFLLLVAFVAGAVVAYVVLSRLVPDVDRLETGARKEGEH
jgi:phage shock protein PspC (stress-responsive transcriptional regulator)